MVDLEYIKIAGVDIGIYKKGPVGIGVSCGADSALLLYVLMTKVTDRIHIYNMMANWRRAALEEPFENVVKKCAELTGNTNYTIHKEYVDDPSAEFYIEMINTALDKKEVDIVYYGLTVFPPKEEWKTWPVKHQPEWHNELRSDKIQHPVFGFNIPVELATDFGQECPLTSDGRPTDNLSLDERVYIPLYNYNKKYIAKMYKELDIEQTLYPITRSCEDDSHIGSHCGDCFWCKERKWAFGYLE